jgi:hypothetical protein
VTRVDFAVHVAAGTAAVMLRFDEAADEPAVIVGWFTSDTNVSATVESNGSHRWELAIEGPGFKAHGPVVVSIRASTAAVDPGSTIAVAMNVKPRGLLGFAGPLLGLAGGKIEREARTALWKEFGRP